MSVIMSHIQRFDLRKLVRWDRWWRWMVQKKHLVSSQYIIPNI